MQKQTSYLCRTLHNHAGNQSKRGISVLELYMKGAKIELIILYFARSILYAFQIRCGTLDL